MESTVKDILENLNKLETTVTERMDKMEEDSKNNLVTAEDITNLKNAQDALNKENESLKNKMEAELKSKRDNSADLIRPNKIEAWSLIHI